MLWTFSLLFKSPIPHPSLGIFFFFFFTLEIQVPARPRDSRPLSHGSCNWRSFTPLLPPTGPAPWLDYISHNALCSLPIARPLGSSWEPLPPLFSSVGQAPCPDYISHDALQSPPAAQVHHGNFRKECLMPLVPPWALLPGQTTSPNMHCSLSPAAEAPAGSILVMSVQHQAPWGPHSPTIIQIINNNNNPTVRSLPPR